MTPEPPAAAPLSDPVAISQPSVLVSTCPAGETFSLPQPADYDQELRRLQRIVNEQRLLGREIVVVMGVGFVGAVMAGVVADSVDRVTGDSTKFVIGMQRPSPRSFWKIHYLNRGLAPVQAEDPEVAPMIRRCVLEKKTLTATFTYDALSLADVVVVDVQCDYLKETLGNVRQGRADIAALEDSLKVVGEKINPECLVLIETTVPPGTTEYVAYPIVKKAFERRGLKKTGLRTEDSGLSNTNRSGQASSPHGDTRDSVLSTQSSALSPQHSVLSTQSSALSPQHSVLSTQSSALSPQTWKRRSRFLRIRSSVSCPAGTMCHPFGISGESAAA